MVSIAVIGAGYWGQKVISEYSNVALTQEDLTVAAIADLSQDMVKVALGRFPGVGKGTTDVDELLSRKDINAVHICTPNETHYALALKALKAGKHVLLEKPMAMTASECYELVEQASKRRLVLEVGHIFRFNESVKRLREFIQEGALGKIYSLRIRWSSNLVPLPSRDIIFDLGPHPVDISHFILNEWPYKVMARSKSYVRREVDREEEGLFVMEFPDGKDAFVELSWISPGEKIREVYVRGSRATIRVDALRQRIRLYDADNDSGASEGGESIEVKQNNTIADEILHFVQQIRGSSVSVNSGYIGARTVEVLEALRRSSIEERFVLVWKELGHHNMQHDPMYSKVEGATFGPKTRVHDQVNLYKCKVGGGCKIDAFVYIEEGVKIGNNVKIRPFTFIPSGVVIEDEVFIGPHVTFTNDKCPRSSGSWRLLPTTVKRAASIGAGATLVPGITVGEHALVGAGAVVTKDVPASSIVTGNPARVVGLVGPARELSVAQPKA